MQLYRERAPNDPLKHVQNLALIDAVSTADTRDDFIARFADTLDRNDTWQYIPGGGNNSPTVVIYRGDSILFIGRGMVNYNNVPTLVANWTLPFWDAATRGMGGAFVRAFQAIADQCLALKLGTWRNITLIGHSYGGATAHVGHALMRRYNRDANIDSWSYGAPRFALDEGIREWRGAAVYRIWNDLDPVVRIPPHTAEAPLLMAPLAPATRAGMNLQIQPVGGLAIDRQGRYIPVSAGAAPVIVHPLALPAWLAGVNAFGSAQHDLATYIGRAGRSVGNPDNAQPARPPARGDLQRAPSPRESHELLREALQETGIQNGQDLKAYARAILAAQVLIAGLVFHRYTQYGVRCITYNGEVVGVTDGKRMQKKLLHILNLMLKN